MRAYLLLLLRIAGLLPVALASVVVLGCTYVDEPGPLTIFKPALELQRSDPAPGARDVVTNPTIDLFFNVPIAAESLDATDIRLFSGVIEFPGTLSVDLLLHRARFVPLQPLRPHLRHQLYISSNFRGLDGSKLPEARSLELMTGDASGPSPSTIPQVLAEQLQPLWEARCVRCHSGAQPRAGLDLSSPTAARSALVGVRSTEAPLLRVDAGNHAKSYLMRKLIGRLGISGLPMPPEAEQKLTEAQLRRVADWIDAGAK